MQSHSTRGAWIETPYAIDDKEIVQVALHEGCVDRNVIASVFAAVYDVALHEGCVDRN